MKFSPAKYRLLKTASRLFIARGFSGVGIDEIIRQSKIAKATFYRHFPSKENLVETWLADIHENAELEQNRILSGSDSPIGKVAASFDALGDYMQNNDFRGCPYSNSCAVSNSLETGIREQIEQHKNSCREFYRKLSFAITGSEQDAAELGDRILILYSGAATESQNVRDLWPIAAGRSAALKLCRLSQRLPHQES